MTELTPITDSQYLQDYFEKISGVGHIEAGSKLKGIWPKDLCPVEDRSLFEWEYFINPLTEKGKEKGLEIIDAACGNGTKSLPLGIFLAERVPNVVITLVDMQEEALTAAQSYANKLDIPSNLRINYQVAKLSEFEVEPNSVDGINFLNALHFIEPKEAAITLSNLRMSLKSDALLCGETCSIFNAAAIGNDYIELDKVLTETENGSSATPYRSMHRRYGEMYFYTEPALI